MHNLQVYYAAFLLAALDQIQDGGWQPSWKISNGHISATGRPIDFVFDRRVGFSGTANRITRFACPFVRPSVPYRLVARKQ